jgi:arylsulfatase A-like enzyme
MKLARVAVLLLAGCASSAPAPTPPRPPNVLWIIADDLSPALGCYGDPTATTPALDRLAREGVRYRNAWSTAPICAPARSALITGLYATALGTQHLRSEVRLPDAVRPLPRLLRDAGWYCTNLNKTDYNFDPKPLFDRISASRTPWRDRPDGRPFFSVINLGATHEGSINRKEAYLKAVEGLPRLDPARVVVPPFYPDTPGIRELFARVADLASAMDRQVGEILEELRKDGHDRDTVVFFFSDHGHGLPRYKRWLNDSGLRIPLIIRTPERYRPLAERGPGETSDRLVSLVDVAPSVLGLAGLPVPPTMQGSAFLGPKPGEPRRFVFGARDRADDMFECSRAVSDGRHLYVRHYLPHLPPIQPGKIYDDEKDAFRELRTLHREGRLAGPPAALWADRKPLEELYDLQADPHELRNRKDDPALAAVKHRLRDELRSWIVGHGDLGLLTEAEYQVRAGDATPWDLMRRMPEADRRRLLEAAERSGDPAAPPAALENDLADPEPGVRYWAAVGLRGRGLPGPLEKALDDASPSVRIAAAEGLASAGAHEKALSTLGALAEDARPWVALEASRALVFLGSRAKPLVPAMRRVIEKNRSAPGSPRPWKDFTYAAFTTWALEAALANCGELKAPGR